MHSWHSESSLCASAMGYFSRRCSPAILILHGPLTPANGDSAAPAFGRLGDRRVSDVCELRGHAERELCGLACSGGGRQLQHFWCASLLDWRKLQRARAARRARVLRVEEREPRDY